MKTMKKLKAMACFIVMCSLAGCGEESATDNVGVVDYGNKGNVAEKGVIGDTIAITRGEACRIVALSFYTKEEIKNFEKYYNFKDVESNENEMYINACVKLGYITDNESFRPDELLTINEAQAIANNISKNSVVLKFNAEEQEGECMTLGQLSQTQGDTVEEDELGSDEDELEVHIHTQGFDVDQLRERMGGGLEQEEEWEQRHETCTQEFDVEGIRTAAGATHDQDKKRAPDRDRRVPEIDVEGTRKATEATREWDKDRAHGQDTNTQEFDVEGITAGVGERHMQGKTHQKTPLKEKPTDDLPVLSLISGQKEHQRQEPDPLRPLPRLHPITSRSPLATKTTTVTTNFSPTFIYIFHCILFFLLRLDVPPVLCTVLLTFLRLQRFFCMLCGTVCLHATDDDRC